MKENDLCNKKVLKLIWRHVKKKKKKHHPTQPTLIFPWSGYLVQNAKADKQIAMFIDDVN